MQKLKRVLQFIDKINHGTGKYVSLLIIVMFSIILLEIVLRYIFRSPTIWVHETSGYMLFVLVALGGGYALYLKAHVNVDVLVSRLSLRWKASLDMVTSILFFAFCGILLWKGVDFAWTSILRLEHSNTYWAPPLYPIKIFFPIGATLIIIQGLAKFTRDLATAITGEEIL